MTHDSIIYRPGDCHTIDRGNGARTTKLVRSSDGPQSFLNGITRFDPGAAIGLHFHNCEESVMVIEGTGIVEIDGERHEMQKDDVVWIQSGVPHRFINETDQPMAIFWTYASTNATRTMVETGVESLVEQEG